MSNLYLFKNCNFNTFHKEFPTVEPSKALPSNQKVGGLSLPMGFISFFVIFDLFLYFFVFRPFQKDYHSIPGTDSNSRPFANENIDI